MQNPTHERRNPIAEIEIDLIPIGFEAEPPKEPQDIFKPLASVIICKVAKEKNRKAENTNAGLRNLSSVNKAKPIVN
ncbi:hypothetical protein KIH39_12800 [Telmatocola sphagniphila]|uniref:Uncharacterized protein n=1 Tax=Telmatocola sphagniphila TaxID=1123043 RepID=A0A8E6BBL0_9BACT|nr:hypothetical protein [Telmatocola sphagniphila]QVL34746.1 hypothetical protein KIH39_12800 [Telmatocola sphagniphila]